MAKFSLKRPLKLIVKGASQSVIPNPQGIPMVVATPAIVVDLKAGIFDTDDASIIERIRKDAHYNTAEGIIEITEEEQEAIGIRAKKDKEADDEIKAAKAKRKAKI
jgi:hypothetical protein